jgi:hypothetical protein
MSGRYFPFPKPPHPVSRRRRRFIDYLPFGPFPRPPPGAHDQCHRPVRWLVLPWAKRYLEAEGCRRPVRRPFDRGPSDLELLFEELCPQRTANQRKSILVSQGCMDLARANRDGIVASNTGRVNIVRATILSNLVGMAHFTSPVTLFWCVSYRCRHNPEWPLELPLLPGESRRLRCPECDGCLSITYL